LFSKRYLYLLLPTCEFFLKEKAKIKNQG